MQTPGISPCRCVCVSGGGGAGWQVWFPRTAAQVQPRVASSCRLVRGPHCWQLAHGLAGPVAWLRRCAWWGGRRSEPAPVAQCGCAAAAAAAAAQALSHFSYHVTAGELVLCDLQGGWSADRGFVLTDPVILSSNGKRAYGPTDLSEAGISTFFARHKCNQFCKQHWRKPARCVECFPASKHTTFA